MTVLRIRKKPVEVTAVCWTGDNWREVYDFCKNAKGVSEAGGPMPSGDLHIVTLEDGPAAEPVVQHVASKGDYIIRGIKGEFYPVKPDIFHGSYDIIKTESPGPFCLICNRAPSAGCYGDADDGSGAHDILGGG